MWVDEVGWFEGDWWVVIEVWLLKVLNWVRDDDNIVLKFIRVVIVLEFIKF